MGMREVHLVEGESALFERNPVHVEYRAIRRYDADGLANSIGDRAKLRLTLSQPILGALAVVDVGCRRVPADDLAAFIFQRIVLHKVPAILPALMQKAHLQIERNSLQQSDPTLIAHPIYIVRMAESRYEPFDRLAQGESANIQRNPVHVECRALRRQDADGLANSVGDRAKVALVRLQCLFSLLAIIYVCEEQIPRGYLIFRISHREAASLEPSVNAISALATVLNLVDLSRFD